MKHTRNPEAFHEFPGDLDNLDEFRKNVGPKRQWEMDQLLEKQNGGLNQAGALARVSELFSNAAFDRIDIDNLLLLAIQVEEQNADKPRTEHISLVKVNQKANWSKQPFDSAKISILPEFEQALLMIEKVIDPQYELDARGQVKKTASGERIPVMVNGKMVPRPRIDLPKCYDLSQTSARDRWLRWPQPKPMTPSREQVANLEKQLTQLFACPGLPSMSADPVDAFFDVSYGLLQRGGKCGHAAAVLFANALAHACQMRMDLRLPPISANQAPTLQDLKQARNDLELVRQKVDLPRLFGFEPPPPIWRH